MSRDEEIAFVVDPCASCSDSEKKVLASLF